MDGSVHLQYANLEQPVFFNGCGNLVELLREISKGVVVREITKVSPHVPQIIISLVGNRYVRESAWLENAVELEDPVDAVCDLTVDLMHGMVSATPSSLCFHCAAVMFGEGLYIIPATYRAGKSLLSAYLSYLGARLYTDDALLITSGLKTGMATGLLPRIRLPLPDGLNDSFRIFVRDRGSIRNRRYCYLKLHSSEMVSYGTTAPIKGVIMLDRGSAVKPRLEQARRKDVVKEIILRNFAREEKPADIVDRITAIVDESEYYRLTYQDVRSGAKLLVDTLGIPGSSKT